MGESKMNKWLKIGTIVVVVALGIAAVTGIVLAQGPADDTGTCGEEMGEGYQRGRRFELGDSTQWQGQAWNREGEFPCDDFVDKDGDGVCDLCGAELGEQMMYGWRYNSEGDEQRPGWGRSENGEATCEDFVDEDGDGVCDNHDEGALVQGGDGYGARGSQMADGGRMGGRGGSRSNGK
jgi:hypothetical protein